jgi:hypothetical protein
MLTLARLFPATAVPGVRAERAPLKTVCRATGGGRRNNSRSPKTKPQNVAPGRASTKASVSTGKNTVDSSVHATAFDAPFDDAPAPVAPATPVNTPAAPRETKVYDDVDCIIEVRFRPRYPPFAPRGVRSDPNFGPVRFKNVD